MPKIILKSFIKIIILVLVISISAVAQTASTEIDRSELFTRAYKSLSFFIFMAKQDITFDRSLTPDESKMLSGIYGIASETATLNWFIKNKIHRFENKSTYIYSYTITNDRPVSLETPLEGPIGIQFSGDQQLFNLDPKQPTRSAVTQASMDQDIFINLSKINDRTQSIDLALAMSILVHEFGHKLDQEKIQNAVDTLAAKLEKYVRSMTNITEINGQKISIVRFRNIPYDQWLENVIAGEYQGVNRAPKVHPLTVLDGQGVYAWVETKNRIIDLTDTITGSIANKNVIQYKDQPNYQFVKHNVILASDLTVEADANGHLKFSMNSNLLQLVLPFMTATSFDPKEYQLYKKAYPIMQPYVGVFQNNDFVIDEKTLALKFERTKPLNYLVPNFQVEFIDKRVRGQDLEIFFKVTGDRKMTIDRNLPDALLWPEILVRIGRSEVTLKATNYYDQADEFKFVLKNIESLKNQDVVIKGLQLRLKDQYLPLSNSDLIAKTLMPTPITLLKAEKKGPTLFLKTTLKSVLVWDGNSWKRMAGQKAPRTGSLLRFVFDSTETLRELTLNQRFSADIQVSSTIFGQTTAAHHVQEPRQKQIRFDESSMRQTLMAGQLFVDVNVDHGLLTRFSFSERVMQDEGDGSRLRESPITDNTEMKTNSLRRISDVSFVTTSGQTNEFALKKDLPFKKAEGNLFPGADSLQFIKPKKLSCQILF